MRAYRIFVIAEAVALVALVALAAAAFLLPQRRLTVSVATPSSPAPAAVYRHAAAGRLSLAQVAAARRTRVALLVRASASGPMSAANLAALDAYLSAGASRPMPRGLVYYTYAGPARG